jgi:maltose alpha-D-glucosyltransferase/alpha-amylase
LEAALQGWLPSRRWFGGKAKTIKTVNLLDVLPVPMESGRAFFTFVQVEYVQDDPETYTLPLACALGKKADPICRDWPPLVAARVSIKNSGENGVIYDAIADQDFCRAVLEMISNRHALQGKYGELAATHTPMLRRLRRQDGLDLTPSVSKAEQSNSAVIYGDKLILKLFRHLDVGVNPDLEIGRYLMAREFPHTPPLAGALEYHGPGQDEPVTVGILSAFVPDCKTAWDYTLDTLSRFYERVQTLPSQKNLAPPPPSASVVRLAAMEIPPEVSEMLGSYAQDAATLGERTAAMHLALASAPDDPDFRPEALTTNAQRGLFQSLRNLTRQNLQLLSARLKTLPLPAQAQAEQVLGLADTLNQQFRRLYETRLEAARIRIHGDYHLGQILHTGKDFLIIDFEGEPAIPLSERRLKRSPLYDVAGMILSFHYAAYAALLKETEHGSLQEGQMKAAVSWERYWASWVSAIFLRAYLKSSHNAPYLPPTEPELRILLETALLRDAIYELGYELNNRPDWVKIPIQAILELVHPEGGT